MSNKTVRVVRDGEVVTLELESRHFIIDPGALDWDLCNMGQILVNYGEIEAELKAEVERLDSSLELLTANLDTETRAWAKGAGEKITENQISRTITKNEGYQEAVEALRLTRRDHNLMRWAMTALSKKVECLINLSLRERQLMKSEGS